MCGHFGQLVGQCSEQQVGTIPALNQGSQTQLALTQELGQSVGHIFKNV